MDRAGVTLTPRRFASDEILFLIRLQVDAMMRAVVVLLLVWIALTTARAQGPVRRVAVSVVDENGQPVQGAQVTIAEPGLAAAQVWTDYAGNCSYPLKQQKPYRIRVDKPGFYEAAESGIDSSQSSIRVILAHEQMVREQVNVTASTPGIDTQQVSNQSTLNMPEIVNIPYQTSRDIRYLLPFNPGRGAGRDRTGACGRLGDVADAGHAGRIRYPLAAERLAEPAGERGCGALHRLGDRRATRWNSDAPPAA